MVNTGRLLMLSADREILVGRLDSAHGIFPELDLTVDAGLEEGVSRRHARIYMRDGTCFVEDLDSTNGSFLNGDRITPYLPLLRFTTAMCYHLITTTQSLHHQCGRRSIDSQGSISMPYTVLLHLLNEDSVVGEPEVDAGTQPAVRRAEEPTLSRRDAKFPSAS